MKQCTGCRKDKDISGYNKRSASPDGHTSMCKVCLAKKKQDNKEKYKKTADDWYKKNKEEVLVKAKIYAKENREKISEREKEYRIKNIEAVKGRQKSWEENNKDYRKNYRKQWLSKNSDHVKEYTRRRYSENTERLREVSRKWGHDNPDKVYANTSKRHADKLHRTPQWFESSKVYEVYKKRNELQLLWGVSLHVDHVIPLRGKEVSGLHCWANLQILEASHNISKSNNMAEVTGWLYQ